MVEKIRYIRNPLTIVAVFAILAEIAGTISPAVLDSQYHSQIVLFVIVFPILLVVLFFLTLWFKPWVLYAPSDFQNEKYFVQMFKEARRASFELDRIALQFQDLIKKAVGEAVSSGGDPQKSSGRLTDVLTPESLQIMNKISSVKSSLEDCAMNVLAHVGPHSRLQNDILQELIRNSRPLLFSEIRTRIRRDEEEIKKALDRMVHRGLLRVSGPACDASYSIDI